MSLLRNLFWAGVFALVLALAPDFGILGPATDGRQKAGLSDLFDVISDTVADISEICSRRPEVCEKMDRIAEQFRNRAVRITGAAHEWLTHADFDDRPRLRAELPTAAVPAPAPGRAGRASYVVAEKPPQKR